MAEEPVTLQGIPNILDIRVIEGIAKEIGISIQRTEAGEIVVDSSRLQSTDLSLEKTSAFRSSYYFVGALLARTGKVKIGYPGGDDFVSRPIDQHHKVMTALGAKVHLHESYYVVEANKLTGNTIFFDTITCGATINAILAAVLAEGTTILYNAARDPEVVDTANLLNQMGAVIRGAGTDKIRIEGVKRLSGCHYMVIPDRLVAGAFLMAAGMTGGVVTVDEVIPEHLASCLAKLKEIGLIIETKEKSITAYGDVRLRPTRIRTGMYPSFATDLQQPLTSLLLLATGRSIVADRIYPERFNHVPQLRRMGAHIELKKGSAFIQGGAPLQGNLVHASDVRAGTSLILAGLAAEGITTITGIEHIERGNEDIVGLFNGLGARLTLHEGVALHHLDGASEESFGAQA